MGLTGCPETSVSNYHYKLRSIRKERRSEIMYVEGDLNFFRSLTVCVLEGGRDSSVGIATRYGLEGPGIESRWGRDFQHPSRPALGPIQPPIQWVPGGAWS